MAQIPNYVADTQYLIWIWFGLALLFLLTALACLLGLDFYRDMRALRRAVTQTPTRP